MTYRELLELYKTGKLQGEEKEKLEREIEKQDAISEYLFEKTEVDGFEPESQTPDPENDAMLKAIQKSVRRTLRRMALTVGAAVLALVAAGSLLLPGLVDEFYYQPDDIVQQDTEYPNITLDRMSLDLSVWSELYLPGAYRDTVYSESEGFGRYSISIPDNYYLDNKQQTVNGRLVRGKLTLYDTDTLAVPTGNAFSMPSEVKGGGGLWDANADCWVNPWGAGVEDAAERVAELDDGAYYLGFVSLKNIMDYEAFYRWYESLEPEATSAWCAVYADEDGYSIQENIGFNFRESGFSRDYEPEKYPFLSILSSKNAPDKASEADMRRHFLSLLDYQLDHPEFGQLFAPGRTPTPEKLEDIRASVAENGIRTYGFALCTKKAELERLLKDPHVANLYAKPMP